MPLKWPVRSLATIEDRFLQSPRSILPTRGPDINPWGVGYPGRGNNFSFICYCTIHGRWLPEPPKRLDFCLLVRKRLRNTMKEPESLKTIIPWILKACDDERYPELMYWVDRISKVFFLSWIHKSSENWNESMSKVFEDWASYKKKLGEKDARDLKAAFRNALRSKKNLKLVKKEKQYRHWQILDEQSVEDNIPLDRSNNKVIKPKQKRGPKKGSRRCNTKRIETKKDDNSNSDSRSINSTVPIVTNFTRSSITPYTPNIDSILLNPNPLPSYNSVFNASPPTPPTQSTDVLLQTLVEQSEFFGLPELEQIPSPCHRTPSPLLMPCAMEGIQETASQVSSVNSDIRAYSPMTHAPQHSNASYPDNSFLTINEVRKEQVVPTVNFDLWNYELSLEHPQIFQEIQVDSKQKEIELETAHQQNSDQNPMYNLVLEESLNKKAEFIPNHPMLSSMDDDIFRYLWDIPEMMR